jgi:hypothetical protein
MLLPALIFIVEVSGAFNTAAAQGINLPSYVKDRGTGVAASLFGTYIRQGQLLFYPFIEYSRDNNREYQPAEFGLGGNVDFRGRFHGSAGQFFVGYGITDWLALEFEAAFQSATLRKSPRDTFATPAKIHESGVGDIEGQLRARLKRENDHFPEIFSYAEITVPSQRHKLLIGDPDWDVKPGVGLVKGFSWGTVTLRIAAEYNHRESKLDLGEGAVEYLKRLSSSVRLYLAVEGGEGGAMDEWDFISGVQLRVRDFVSLKVDNALGISSKATDWAPQIGLMFALPP